MKDTKIVGIYKITSPSGKIYIGQTIDILGRWKRDYYKLRCKGQPKLYNSLKSYGVKNHKFEIVEEIKHELYSENLINEREIHWGKVYEVLDPNKGLNTKELGKNGRHSEETKLKISNKLKGRKPFQNKTKEEIELIYKNRNIKSSKGKILSQETKNKISKSSKGISRNKGRKISDETKNKMSEVVKNRIYTPERLEKMRQSMMGKGTTPIICITTNEYFSSIKEAAEKFNLNKASIDHILSGKGIKTRSGLKFKYA